MYKCMYIGTCICTNILEHIKLFQYEIGIKFNGSCIIAQMYIYTNIFNFN